MIIRGTIGVLVLVLALLACSGCLQPDKTMEQVPVNTSVNSTSVPVFVPAPTVTGQTGTIPAPVTIVATTGPAGQATLPALPAGNPEPGVFVRYTGADYSIDYPAAWSTNSTILPLREYRYLPPECSVTFAYNLDQELRMYYSRDGSTLFYSGIVNTDRDIWPRNGDQVVYVDIINSVLGYPEYCANYEGNEAFTIGGISQVPLEGVSYTGVRADFARINATGFTVGTGTAYVVTGKNHSGVFTFYSTSMDDTQANLSEYIFNSLHLDPGF
ncbi:MAG: hypothetical protein ACYDEZ_04565 [Methanoregula sp.]|jgi:hypothetical protein